MFKSFLLFCSFFFMLFTHSFLIQPIIIIHKYMGNASHGFYFLKKSFYFVFAIALWEGVVKFIVKNPKFSLLNKISVGMRAYFCIKSLLVLYNKINAYAHHNDSDDRPSVDTQSVRLEREIEKLKNEIELTKQEHDHMVQMIKHERDMLRNKQHEYEDEKKRLIEQVRQLTGKINELEGAVKQGQDERIEFEKIYRHTEASESKWAREYVMLERKMHEITQQESVKFKKLNDTYEKDKQRFEDEKKQLVAEKNQLVNCANKLDKDAFTILAVVWQSIVDSNTPVRTCNSIRWVDDFVKSAQGPFGMGSNAFRMFIKHIDGSHALVPQFVQFVSSSMPLTFSHLITEMKKELPRMLSGKHMSMF